MKDFIIKSYPRYRSRTQPEPAINKWLDTTCKDCSHRGVVTTLLSQATSKLGTYETMDDMVTPDYARLSGEGYIVMTPMKRVYENHQCWGDYSKTRRISTSSFGCGTAPVCHEDKDYRGPWALNYLNGNPVGGTQLQVMSALSQSDISAAHSAASTATWDNTGHHSADILQDIAEIHQVLNLLHNPLQRGHEFIDKILSKGRGAKYVTAADAYEYASSLWLQYRYGIRPLVSTIDGILKELSHEQRPLRQTSRGKFKLYESRSTPGVLTLNASTNDYVLTVEDSYDVSCGVIIDEVITLRQALGVDASGMLSLPWELVPYSFVADWFINVGSFLKAVIPSITKRPVGSWTTSRREQRVSFQITHSEAASPSQFQLIRAANESWLSSWITTTRVPYIAGPSITLKPFAYKSVLTDARLIDSITLLTQKLGRVFSH